MGSGACGRQVQEALQPDLQQSPTFRNLIRPALLRISVMTPASEAPTALPVAAAQELSDHDEAWPSEVWPAAIAGEGPDSRGPPRGFWPDGGRCGGAEC